jgi:hypothetical protein
MGFRIKCLRHGKATLDQPSATDPAHQIHVLHQRQHPKAAEALVEGARDQERLIAVGQAEDPASPGDHGLESARDRPRIVEGEAEIGSTIGEGRRGREAQGSVEPPRAEHSVGMHEQQPITLDRPCARRELTPPPPRGAQHPNAETTGDLGGAIDRAAVGHHQIEPRPGACGAESSQA